MSHIVFTPPAPQNWVPLSTSAQVQLTAGGSSVQLGHLFSFHPFFVSAVSTSPSWDSGDLCTLMLILAVTDIHSPRHNGLRCTVEVEYACRNNDFEEFTTSGVWKPQPILLASINPDQLISFTLPADGLALHHAVMVTRVTVFAQRLQADEPTPTTCAVPTRFQHARTSALLSPINNANLCDCSLLPSDTNGAAIMVSRAILAHASPFFMAMFNGTWSEATERARPIALDWTVASVLACLIHMYSGWVLGEPLPQAKELDVLLQTHEVDFNKLTVQQLIELLDFADMLELPLLVHAANQEMISVLKSRSLRTWTMVESLTRPIKVFGPSAVGGTERTEYD